MGGLTETERSLLSLRFFENLSQRETARRLNMTQMQISRAERRALAALRKEMTGEP
jgi:RNA polymerase sigma factor (sigma-70 family)